jgi:hypothetical protein
MIVKSNFYFVIHKCMPIEKRIIYYGSMVIHY